MTIATTYEVVLAAVVLGLRAIACTRLGAPGQRRRGVGGGRN
jgi:hypothetical protein